VDFLSGHCRSGDKCPLKHSYPYGTAAAWRKPIPANVTTASASAVTRSPADTTDASADSIAAAAMSNDARDNPPSSASRVVETTSAEQVVSGHPCAAWDTSSTLDGSRGRGNGEGPETGQGSHTPEEQGGEEAEEMGMGEEEGREGAAAWFEGEEYENGEQRKDEGVTGEEGKAEEEEEWDEAEVREGAETQEEGEGRIVDAADPVDGQAPVTPAVGQAATSSALSTPQASAGPPASASQHRRRSSTDDALVTPRPGRRRRSEGAADSPLPERLTLPPLTPAGLAATGVGTSPPTPVQPPPPVARCYERVVGLQGHFVLGHTPNAQRARAVRAAMLVAASGLQR